MSGGTRSSPPSKLFIFHIKCLKMLPNPAVHSFTTRKQHHPPSRPQHCFSKLPSSVSFTRYNRLISPVWHDDAKVSDKVAARSTRRHQLVGSQMGVGLMLRPWSQACKTEQKQGPRMAVDVLTGASSAVCMLFAHGTTLTFATKLHPPPRWYLSTSGCNSLLIKSKKHWFSYWLELNWNPYPHPITPSFFHLFYYDLFVRQGSHMNSLL